jgi:Fe-S cluster assembly protein SufB
MTDTPVKDAAAHAAAARVADYEHGWSSDIETEFRAQGPERGHGPLHLGQEERAGMDAGLAAEGLRHWLTMTMPDWAKLNVPPIDYQDAYYYAAPKAKPKLGSLDEVDPEILRVYEKLGIPLEEQKVLAGVEGARKVAVDAVFDSAFRVATTFRARSWKRRASSSARSPRRSANIRNW